jgi:hypothetical protein
MDSTPNDTKLDLYGKEASKMFSDGYNENWYELRF